MVGRGLASAAAIAALCLTLGGCVGPGGAWQFPQFMTPPSRPASQAHYYAPSPRPSPPPSESRAVSGSSEHESAASRPSAPASADAAPPAAVAAPPAEAAPQPTVTLAGGGDSRDRALHLLDDAGARLARIDRSKLSGDSAATYDQANGFLSAGRKAAIDQDYVAATGYAEKASVLANKLAPPSQ